ncbi:hypothetical protein POM88_035332 [Heracleum sosnowskyi]|uniref:Uncharacterized protein n=1 Tax=Heracleum sosnowskyi TaxID=360622 RepID=A0AAD8MBF8_9APIA|nr:hypothetical protein POM88_035332 [Heracleum sosnowskyi]
MANQQANKIVESDAKDATTLMYLGRRMQKQKQWWLANTEFTEHDLDLISSMADLFLPMNASNSMMLDRKRQHVRHFLSNSNIQIDGADSTVTYSELRDLVKKIRASAAFPKALAIPN